MKLPVTSDRHAANGRLSGVPAICRRSSPAASSILQIFANAIGDQELLTSR
jgi:hypothetical protein